MGVQAGEGDTSSASVCLQLRMVYGSVVEQGGVPSPEGPYVYIYIYIDMWNIHIYIVRERDIYI